MNVCKEKKDIKKSNKCLRSTNSNYYTVFFLTLTPSYELMAAAFIHWIDATYLRALRQNNMSEWSFQEK
jgi:hypothetical protein